MGQSPSKKSIRESSSSSCWPWKPKTHFLIDFRGQKLLKWWGTSGFNTNIVHILQDLEDVFDWAERSGRHSQNLWKSRPPHLHVSALILHHGQSPPVCWNLANNKDWLKLLQIWDSREAWEESQITVQTVENLFWSEPGKPKSRTHPGGQERSRATWKELQTSQD